MVLTPKNENKIMSLLVGNNQDIPANQTSQSGPFAVKLGYLPNSCDIQNLKILRQLNCLNGFKPLDAEDVRGQLTFEAGNRKPGAKLSEDFQACILKVSRNIKSVMLAKIQML